MITKEQYPKTYQYITQWLKGKSQMHGLPPEAMKLLEPTNMVQMILTSQARVLFEAFDERGIHVGIWHSGDGWRYNVHHLQGQKWNVADSHIGGKNRSETEGMAFELAAKIIESI